MESVIIAVIFLGVVCLVLLAMVVWMSFRLNRLEQMIEESLTPFPLTPDQIVREGGDPFDIYDDNEHPAFLKRQAD